MNFKKIVPHVIAVILMLVTAFVFFAPAAFDGKVLQQPDNEKAAASQAEIEKFTKETGKPVLWTNAYFSGMPTAQIYQGINGNLTQPIFRIALLGKSMTAPHPSVFLAMLAAYFMLLVLSVDWRLALIGAFGFGLSNYNMDIIEAGHSTKMVALAFAPAIIGAAIMTFRGKWLLGGALFALFLSLQIYSNHYQITYYTFFILLTLGIVELVAAARTKDWGNFTKGTLALVVGAGLSLGSNATSLWTTYEYQKFSTRGASQLKNTVSQNLNTGGGLSKNYVFGWSLGLAETMTLLVPRFYGGGASETHDDTKTYKAVYGNIAQQLAQNPGITPAEVKKSASRQVSSLFYYGNQPFVGVSIYYGAILMFLTVLSITLVKTREKWLIAISGLLMLMIAWGDNFFFGTLMYEFFPLFNKFRAVTQALGLGQLMVAALAMLGLQAWFNKDIENAQKQKALTISLGVTLLFCLIGMVGGDVTGGIDAKLPKDIIPMLHEDRAALSRSDAMRSLMLILLTAGTLFAALKGSIKNAWLAVAIVGVLSLGDIWLVSKRVMNADKFEVAQTLTKEQAPKPADLKVQEDKDPHYRVLDLRGNDPFQNAATSLYHKSVGGYHAAKMRIYQEMIDKHFLNPKTPQEQLMRLYGMFNAKYIIQSDDANGVTKNPMALGNAWFVKEVKIVNSPDEELEAIGTIDPRTTVVLQKQNAEALGATTPPQYDSTATLTLTKYHPDKLTYNLNSKTEQIAVFSEVYYPAEQGWKISIDGQPAKPFVKANYAVRAMKLPAGQHTLEMSYEPNAYYTGEKISFAASASMLLLVVIGLFLAVRTTGLPEANLLPETLATENTTTTPKPAEKNTPAPPKPTIKKSGGNRK